MEPRDRDGDRQITPDGGSWTLLTAHGHVLVAIARNPEARMRDISAAAGITERTAQTVVADLEAAGYLTRARVGRRNTYEVHPERASRHASHGDLRAGPFLDTIRAPGPWVARVSPAPPVGRPREGLMDLP